MNTVASRKPGYRRVAKFSLTLAVYSRLLHNLGLTANRTDQSASNKSLVTDTRIELESIGGIPCILESPLGRAILQANGFSGNPQRVREDP